jgi:hypothetical protein
MSKAPRLQTWQLQNSAIQNSRKHEPGGPRNSGNVWEAEIQELGGETAAKQERNVAAEVLRKPGHNKMGIAAQALCCTSATQCAHKNI